MGRVIMTHEIICRNSGFDDCEFEVRSENRNEVIDAAMRHARDVHAMTMSRKDVEKLVETAG